MGLKSIFSGNTARQIRDKLNATPVELRDAIIADARDGRDAARKARQTKIYATKIETCNADIAFFESRLTTLNGKPATIPEDSHDMTEKVREALAKGWAWEYKADVMARGQTGIYFDICNMKGFQSKMAKVFGVKKSDIGIVATNHSVDYSIQTKENQNRYMQEVNLASFAFEEKDSEQSKYGYGFVRVKDRYYGAVKLGHTWDSRGPVRC